MAASRGRSGVPPHPNAGAKGRSSRVPPTISSNSAASRASSGSMPSGDAGVVYQIVGGVAAEGVDGVCRPLFLPRQREGREIEAAGVLLGLPVAIAVTPREGGRVSGGWHGPGKTAFNAPLG